MSDDKKNKPKFNAPEDVGAVATPDVEPIPLVVEKAPSTKDIIRELMSELMPAMMAMAQAGAAANRVVDPRAERAAVAGGPKCSECRQLLRGCGGKHERIVIYPTKYPEFGAWFRGVGVNGIWYRSDNASQLVTVPAVAVGDILQTVLTYEENERETRMGRSGGHDFGNARAPQQVQPGSGWR